MKYSYQPRIIYTRTTPIILPLPTPITRISRVVPTSPNVARAGPSIPRRTGYLLLLMYAEPARLAAVGHGPCIQAYGLDGSRIVSMSACIHGVDIIVDKRGAWTICARDVKAARAMGVRRAVHAERSMMWSFVRSVVKKRPGFESLLVRR